MKRFNVSFKLLLVILTIAAIGCFQLTAASPQDNGESIPLSIFASAYKHIPGLEKSEAKIIKSVAKELDLKSKKAKYHRGKIDVIDVDADKEGDFLIVCLLDRDRYGMDTTKIILGENYEFLHVERGYVMQSGDSSTEWLPSDRACNCPDETVEILLSTCETGIPTAVAGINYSYDVAVAAGYTAHKLMGSEENTVEIDKWLCCPNLKYWGRIGHGSTTGILVYDGTLSYTYFDSLPAGALLGKSLYFNSCQVFNDPLKSSILNKDAYKFIGGICNLYIGPSEEVFMCWNDNNFYQVTPPGGEPDEMCYWSVECESSTGYPELGCHGCGGPGLIFPQPGGLEPPVADFVGNPTILGAGGTVFFTDLSTNIPTSWAWTFEGGTPATSTEKNPEVIYNTVGTYNVSLTASNSQGSDTETKIDYITVTIPQPPIADFSAASTSIFAGDSVTFTDQSLNTPTSWNWTFEGGTPATSTERNPTITYNTPGTYDVSLTVSNAAGSDTETKLDYMFVDLKPYCASQGNISSMEWIARVQVADLDNPSGASGYTDFTYLTATMQAGSTVNVALTPGFSGTIYTEYWRIWIDYNGDHDFEDAGEEVFSGVGSSTVTGSFTVQSGVDITTRMRVSMKYAGYPTPCETFTYGEVEDYTADIFSDGNLPPIADFTFTTSDLTAYFTDTSTDPDGIVVGRLWDFGDGNMSTLQNPSHTYAAGGTYTVTLTVTDDDGATDSVSKPVTVTEPGVDIYVYDISQTIINQGKNYTSTAVVAIRDTNNNPVADATVYITWSGVVSGSTSGVTGANGTVSFTSAKVKSSGPFTITVDNVTHATQTYNPALNNETSDTAYY